MQRERELPEDQNVQLRQRETLRRDNLLWVNPTDLLRDNPAAQIVNRESYKRIAAHFSSDQFDPPQVVRVKTYTPAGEAVSLFVIDGMTRTKYASDHQEEAAPDDPNFHFSSIPTRDVTRSLLQNPEVVTAEEREEAGQGAEAITMLQYLRAVIPPTIEHSEIASDRIAAHLINGWENMVGADVAQRFSATAALKVLTNDRVYRATERDLQKELTSQRALFAGESIEQRARVQQALLDMASIIRQTKRFPQEIARSAFFLVGTTSPIIGEEVGTRREIYGLLHLPAVEEKLAAFEQVGDREQMRAQLGQVMLDALRRSPNRDNDRVFTSIHESLVDINLSFEDVLNVVTAANPVEQYDTVKRDLNRDRLAEFYQSLFGREELTEYEQALINRLGRKTLLEGRLEPQARVIEEGNKGLERANSVVTEFSTKRQDLINQGVTPTLIDEAVRELTKAQADMLQVDNVRDANTKLRNLVATVDEIERRANTQRKVHQVGELADVVFGEELTAEHGSWLRDQAVSWLAYREFRDTTLNLSTARRFLQQLQSLDTNLRSLIFRGDMTLTAALRRQEEIRQNREQAQRARAQEAGYQTPPTTARPVEMPPFEAGRITPDPSPRQDQTVLNTTISTTEASGVVVSPNVLIPEQQAERERQVREAEEKMLNNAQFKELMRTWIKDLLGVTDLNSLELDRDTRANIDVFMQVIGKLRFNHPDIVRVIEKDYPRLQADVTSLRQTLHYRDDQDLSLGTQTGR